MNICDSAKNRKFIGPNVSVLSDSSYGFHMIISVARDHYFESLHGMFIGGFSVTVVTVIAVALSSVLPDALLCASRAAICATGLQLLRGDLQGRWHWFCMLRSALGCEDVWWERCSLAFVQEVSGRWQEDVVFVSRPSYTCLSFRT